MKKYIPYVIIIFLSSLLLVVLAVNSAKKKDIKIITINSLNTYLYTKNQKIEIPLFINDEKFPIDNINSYNSVKVTDYSEDKIMQLELVEVTKSHEESLYNESFIKYYLKFKMPNLDNNFKIDNAYLKLDFINGLKLELNVGEFHLIYLPNMNELPWSNIDSSKLKYNDFKISKIIIDLEYDIGEIKSIKIDNNDYLQFELLNNKLIIDITNYNLVVTYLPLVIDTYDISYYLPNNHYAIEYNLLEIAERLVNIYVFD